jgi:hypothetical protein
MDKFDSTWKTLVGISTIIAFFFCQTKEVVLNFSKFYGLRINIGMLVRRSRTKDQSVAG